MAGLLLSHIQSPNGILFGKTRGVPLPSRTPPVGILCSCRLPCLWAWHCWRPAQVTREVAGASPPLPPTVSHDPLQRMSLPGSEAAWGAGGRGAPAQTQALLASWPSELRAGVPQGIRGSLGLSCSGGTGGVTSESQESLPSPGQPCCASGTCGSPPALKSALPTENWE